jgi:hypothetical protein
LLLWESRLYSIRVLFGTERQRVEKEKKEEMRNEKEEMRNEK